MFSFLGRLLGGKRAPVAQTLDDEFLRATLWACGWRGMLREEWADWFASHVRAGERAGLGIDQIARNIRQDGGVMPLEEKRALGIHGQLKIGRLCFDRLTELGQRDPNKAVAITVHAALFRVSRANQLARMHNNPRAKSVRVVTVGDDGDCEASRRCKNKTYPLGQVPEFPLPECDAEICRCGYISVQPKRG